MPWKSKKQARWGHGNGGKEAGFSKDEVKEYDDKTEWSDLPDEASSSGKGDPFKPVKEWGSKARKKEAKDKRGANKRKAIKEQTQGSLVAFLHWELVTALQHPTIECPEDYECPEEFEHESEREHEFTAGFLSITGLVAKQNCTKGFASFMRLGAQNGIFDPVSELPPAPQGAAERTKIKMRNGSGLSGEDMFDSPSPMSTLDKFNWDSMPLPGSIFSSK